MFPLLYGPILEATSSIAEGVVAIHLLLGDCGDLAPVISCVCVCVLVNFYSMTSGVPKCVLIRINVQEIDAVQEIFITHSQTCVTVCRQKFLKRPKNGPYTGTIPVDC